MFKQLEFGSWIAGGIAGSLSSAAVGNSLVRPWADKLEEFSLRLRRAGLLFIAVIAALLAISILSHPIGLLLWLVALPLAGFGALLSMMWPTWRLARRRSQNPESAASSSTLAWLRAKRRDVPLVSRPAFDLVIERVQRSETLAGVGEDLLVNETRRLTSQHLPRLVQSFLALPAGERTSGRCSELTEGLVATAEELDELNGRLLASRTDRFEIETRFIASRYPGRNRLAGV